MFIQTLPSIHFIQILHYIRQLLKLRLQINPSRPGLAGRPFSPSLFRIRLETWLVKDPMQITPHTRPPLDCTVR